MIRQSYTAIDYYTVFKSILTDYFRYLIVQVLEKSREIRLPARMGYVSVIKKRPFKTQRHGMNVDFKSTNELGKTILHLNEHSDGYRFRFLWRKNEMLIKNKTMYEMRMSRENKRKLAYIIKNRLFDYVEA
jgi:hypothetical protein